MKSTKILPNLSSAMVLLNLLVLGVLSSRFFHLNGDLISSDCYNI